MRVKGVMYNQNYYIKYSLNFCLDQKLLYLQVLCKHLLGQWMKKINLNYYKPYYVTISDITQLLSSTTFIPQAGIGSIIIGISKE